MIGENTSPRIAIIEDDGSLRMLLVRCIREHGYAVNAYASAAEFRPAIDTVHFDLVILDVMLPGTSGLDICRSLRAESQIPIIFISARGSQADRIVGLELGADDYVVKPVDPDELIARIRAVLRRTQTASSETAASKDTIRFDGWELDQRRRELYAPDGVRVAISDAEFDLLATLAEMPHRVVGRALLLERSRGRLLNADDRSVDVLVSRLRRKLGAVDGGRDLIRTVRGIGYVFSPKARQ